MLSSGRTRKAGVVGEMVINDNNSKQKGGDACSKNLGMQRSTQRVIKTDRFFLTQSMM